MPKPNLKQYSRKDKENSKKPPHKIRKAPPLPFSALYSGKKEDTKDSFSDLLNVKTNELEDKSLCKNESTNAALSLNFTDSFDKLISSKKELQQADGILKCNPNKSESTNDLTCDNLHYLSVRSNAPEEEIKDTSHQHQKNSPLETKHNKSSSCTSSNISMDEEFQKAVTIFKTPKYINTRRKKLKGVHTFTNASLSGKLATAKTLRKLKAEARLDGADDYHINFTNDGDGSITLNLIPAQISKSKNSKCTPNMKRNNCNSNKKVSSKIVLSKLNYFTSTPIQRAQKKMHFTRLPSTVDNVQFAYKSSVYNRESYDIMQSPPLDFSKNELFMGDKRTPELAVSKLKLTPLCSSGGSSAYDTALSMNSASSSESLVPVNNLLETSYDAVCTVADVIGSKNVRNYSSADSIPVQNTSSAKRMKRDLANNCQRDLFESSSDDSLEQIASTEDTNTNFSSHESNKKIIGKGSQYLSEGSVSGNLITSDNELPPDKNDVKITSECLSFKSSNRLELFLKSQENNINFSQLPISSKCCSPFLKPESKKPEFQSPNNYETYLSGAPVLTRRQRKNLVKALSSSLSNKIDMSGSLKIKKRSKQRAMVHQKSKLANYSKNNLSKSSFTSLHQIVTRSQMHALERVESNSETESEYHSENASEQEQSVTEVDIVDVSKSSVDNSFEKENSSKVEQSIEEIDDEKTVINDYASVSESDNSSVHCEDSCNVTSNTPIACSVLLPRLTDDMFLTPQVLPLKRGKGWRRSLSLSYSVNKKRKSLVATRSSDSGASTVRPPVNCTISISQSPRRRPPSLIQRSSASCSLSSKQQVLALCNQSQVIPIAECLSHSDLERCKKIGEGIFGEVYMVSPAPVIEDETKGLTRVLKVMPIEGTAQVNGEPQKTFEEILSEIVISRELSDLRHNSLNNCSSFVHLLKCWCVQGKYPELLLQKWDDFNEKNDSENDRPDMLDDNQLLIVLEFAHGGQDFESFIFSNAKQSMAAFYQISYSLAVAEEALEFEHRDMHWGNVLVADTEEETVSFSLNGRHMKLPSMGVRVTVIDFTLSRLKCSDESIVFNDISKDPDLFTGSGDYQFDIYRKMREANGNDWNIFLPITNVFWLDYLVEKLINECYYKSKKAKLHLTYLRKFDKIQEKIKNMNSAKDIMVNNNLINGDDFE